MFKTTQFSHTRVNTRPIHQLYLLVLLKISICVLKDCESLLLYKNLISYQVATRTCLQLKKNNIVRYYLCVRRSPPTVYFAIFL